jgi:GT2 family glycosyltransferase
MSDEPILTPPRLAVVIPTHERNALIEGLLRALASQTLPLSSFEVVLACDGCTDATAETAMHVVGPGGAAEGLMLTVVEQMRSGAAAARNRGMGATTAPIVVLFDDDMVPEPACLEAHLRAHAAHPGALVLGHMPLHDRSPRSFLTEGLSRWAASRHARLSHPGAAPGFGDVLTGHLSLARSTFGKVGGFDQDLNTGGKFGGEDIDFGYRAVEAGVPLVYAPDAVAGQIYIKTFRHLAKDIHEGTLAHAVLAVKHPEAPRELPRGLAYGIGRHAPAVGRMLAAPLVTLLDRAGRRGATGRDWEALHAVARNLISGIALSEADSLR